MSGSGANGLCTDGLGADGLGKSSFGTNGFGSIRRRQRSFAELVFDLSSDDKDELNAAPDEEDWAGQARDGLRDAFLFASKSLAGERVRPPNSLGNRPGGPFPIEDFVLEGGREGAVTGFAGGVFDQDRSGRPSFAAGCFEPDRSGPSSKFIRLDDDPAATAQEHPARAASFLAAKDTNPITVPLAQVASALPRAQQTRSQEAQGSKLQDFGLQDPKLQAPESQDPESQDPVPQPAEPLAELARMLGRGWARDRRAWMGKGLGGGLGLIK